MEITDVQKLKILTLTLNASEVIECDATMVKLISGAIYEPDIERIRNYCNKEKLSYFIGPISDSKISISFHY